MIKYIFFSWKTPVELTDDKKIIELFSAAIKSKTTESEKQELNYDHIIVFDDIESNSLKSLEIIDKSGEEKFPTVTINKRYVLKRMDKGKFQQLINEFEIMSMLYHPNIQKAEKIITNDKNIPPSILVEYFPFNLEMIVQNKKTSNANLMFLIFQLAETMKYIHSRKIVHNDLKPMKILISENGIIKISGFENSKLMTSQNELCNDIKSFGVIIYFILSGGKIFNLKDKNSLTSFPILAQQLINACCFYETKPSFEKICNILEKKDYNLISLSQQEIQEVKQKIKQYRKQIPF